MVRYLFLETGKPIIKRRCFSISKKEDKKAGE